MLILADEHIPAGVVAAPRAVGHDVWAAAENKAGVSDAEHLARTAREGRVILTEDYDFLDRVRDAIAAGDALPPALIHYRLDGLGRAAKMARMTDAVAQIGTPAAETVYSAEPSRIRSRGMRA